MKDIYINNDMKMEIFVYLESKYINFDVWEFRTIDIDIENEWQWLTKIDKKRISKNGYRISMHLALT